MATHSFIVGTDTAMIGIWDKEWSNPSIRDKSLSKFIKRLPSDAQKKQLFYIETGGDGESSCHLKINEDEIIDSRYRQINTDAVIEIKSGKMIFDGVEWYGSEYGLQNEIDLENGIYSIALFELNDPEEEESEIIPEGEPVEPHIIKKLAPLGLLILIASIVLLFKKQWIVGAILFTFALIHSTIIGKLDEKNKGKRKFRTEIKTPYLILHLEKIDNGNQTGGYVSLV